MHKRILIEKSAKNKRLGESDHENDHKKPNTQGSQNLKTELESQDLFSKIYSKFYKPVSNYVKKYIQSAHIAEEVTQDIFLKIYQNRGSYNPTFALPSWIWTIAKNTIYDHLRKNRAHHPGAIQSLEDLYRTSCFEPASEVTAELLMIEKTDRTHLKQMVSQLSEKQREAIFLRMVKRCSYRDICITMNLSLSAVKSLINRGKTTLISLSQNERLREIENR